MNVAHEVHRILHPIEKLGSFNDIRTRITRECVWHQEYAIFTAEFENPLFNTLLGDREWNDYVEIEYDEGKLINDFRKKLEEGLPNCKITHYPSCDEWEIVGPNNKEFRQQHLDALEELSGLDDKHHVFEVK